MKRIVLNEIAAQRRQNIVALRTQGWSLAKIARQYNCSRQRIFQILERAGQPDKPAADAA